MAASYAVLTQMLADLVARVRERVEYAEGSLRLDLESRKGDRNRQVRHIHQNCGAQISNLRRASEIKLVYLLQAYTLMAEAKNGFGVFMAARSLLEFNAFLFDIKCRLEEARTSVGEHEIEGGVEFFTTLIRARFGTGDPEKVEALTDSGWTKTEIKRFRIGDAIRRLSSEPEWTEVNARYNYQCDYVHHNLSSGALATTGARIGSVADMPGGGISLLPEDAAISVYQYPLEEKALKAVEDTLEGVIADAKAVRIWLAALPESPYSKELLAEATGSRSGSSPVSFQVLGPATPDSTRSSRPGRNDPCPCGSGKKFKKCCGAIAN